MLFEQPTMLLPLEDGTILWRTKVYGSREMNMHPQLVTQVSFGEGIDAQGQPILPLMEESFQAVRHFVVGFVDAVTPR
jgi:hypothetical protein